VSDSGSFYSGRNWIDRGNVIRGNTFRHMRVTEVPVLGAMSVQAIYFDDQISGFTVFNNTFIDCYAGVFIGGGRRHIVTQNDFQDCSTCVHVDDRGLTWQKDSCKPGGSFEQQLQSVNYQQPPWSIRYPELINIMKDHPCVPVYNDIENNTYTNSTKFFDVPDTSLKTWLDTQRNNTEY
jgi:hypothetical protein